MTRIPRLWIARDGRMLNCDDIDESHAAVVVHEAEAFGLSDIAGHLRQMYDSDDFQFDHVIALAEAAGWTRISRDAGEAGGVAISSADPVLAAAALLRLETSHEVFVERVDVEISHLAGATLTQSYHRIEGRHLTLFRRHSRLPAPSVVGRYEVAPPSTLPIAA